jgi:hypothetical protein
MLAMGALALLAVLRTLTARAPYGIIRVAHTLTVE